MILVLAAIQSALWCAKSMAQYCHPWSECERRLQSSWSASTFYKGSPTVYFETRRKLYILRIRAEHKIRSENPSEKQSRLGQIFRRVFVFHQVNRYWYILMEEQKPMFSFEGDVPKELPVEVHSNGMSGSCLFWILNSSHSKVENKQNFRCYFDVITNPFKTYHTFLFQILRTLERSSVSYLLEKMSVRWRKW